MTFGNSILAGTKLVRDAIMSENYVSGISGWIIERNGDAEFNNVTVRGNVISESVIVNGSPGERIKVFKDGTLPVFVIQTGLGFAETFRLDRDKLEFRDVNLGGDPVVILLDPANQQLVLGDTATNGAKYIGYSEDTIQAAETASGADIASVLKLNPFGGQVTYDDVGITRRMGFSERTSDVGTFTAETLVDSVTIAAISGRKYEIDWDAHWSSSVAADRITLRIYEEDTGAGGFGNLIRAMFPPRVSHASSSQLAQMRAFYTADATESKTFNVTMQRSTGTGNVTASASANSPAITTVDEVGT